MSQAKEPAKDQPRAAPGRLSTIQVLASALTAVTSTLALSTLGWVGTIGGAALASVITVTGNWAYGRWLHRGTQAARQVAAQAVALAKQTKSSDGDLDQDDLAVVGQQGELTLEGEVAVQGELNLEAVTPDEDPASVNALDDTNWWATMVAKHGLAKTLGASILAVFLVIMAAVTTVELITGRTLSSKLPSGDDRSGTTFEQLFRRNPQPAYTPSPSPTTQSPTPSEPVSTFVPTPTGEPTIEPTLTNTPTLTPTETTAPPATPTPTGQGPSPT
ncbi:MAG: hypothetical protein FWG16_03375, partial [Micrococcales bacterium]|nr:hypothetical protein [Micrococcales bacterium]